LYNDYRQQAGTMVARDANTKGTLFRLIGIDPFNPMRLIK
jgi:hypothetical protein